MPYQAKQFITSSAPEKSAIVEMMMMAHMQNLQQQQEQEQGQQIDPQQAMEMYQQFGNMGGGLAGGTATAEGASIPGYSLGGGLGGFAGGGSAAMEGAAIPGYSVQGGLGGAGAGGGGGGFMSGAGSFAASPWGLLALAALAGANYHEKKGTHTWKEAATGQAGGKLVDKYYKGIEKASPGSGDFLKFVTDSSTGDFSNAFKSLGKHFLAAPKALKRLF